MLRTPVDKLPVLRQYGVDQLVQHVLGRLAEKVRIGVQGLVVLLIQPRAMFNEMLPPRAGFNHWHGFSFQDTGTLRIQARLRRGAAAEQHPT
jgi:hypothetical protein